MSFSNLNCKLKNFSEVENSNLLKVKILVQHDGSNKNGSKFSLDVIKKAEPTIKNIPILAYIKRDEDGNAIDFDEHNMVTKIVEDGNGFKLATQYLEVPIGVIPSDTEIEYEEIDGRTYLSVTGFVWKRYANEGYQILMNSEEKGTSMEIEIFDGQKDEEDGMYDVLDYQFLGVTCLGDDVEPGMYDTTITKYTSSKKYKKYLEDIYKEIYTLGKEDDFMDNIETNDTEVTTEIESTEEVIENIEVTAEENKVEETEEVIVEDKKTTEDTFALSMDNINVSINSVLKDRLVECENWWGEKYSTREFYLWTVLPEDKIAVLEDNVNYYNYYGVPYEIKGDDVVLDFDAKVPYIQEWRAKKSDEEVVVFNKEDELKTLVLEKFGQKEVELENLKSEMAKLEEFKVAKDKEDLTNKVNDVVSEFINLDESEIEVVKNKALNNEISLDEFKKELFCLVGMKAFASKETFSATEKVEQVHIIDVETHADITDEYGGLVKKYLK